MSAPFSRRKQKAEQDAMTPERILALVSRPDGFRVSWRYRDDWLMGRCQKLAKAGLLRADGGRGETIWRTR